MNKRLKLLDKDEAKLIKKAEIAREKMIKAEKSRKMEFDDIEIESFEEIFD